MENTHSIRPRSRVLFQILSYAQQRVSILKRTRLYDTCGAEQKYHALLCARVLRNLIPTEKNEAKCPTCYHPEPLSGLRTYSWIRMVYLLLYHTWNSSTMPSDQRCSYIQRLPRSCSVATQRDRGSKSWPSFKGIQVCTIM